MNKGGAFIISLDFELHWGVFDHTPLSPGSRAYFDTARELIPPTLKLFSDNGIRATWATVGMLFAHGREQLADWLPPTRPAYRNARFDPYRLMDTLGANEEEDPYHFAPSLIARVADTPGQDIGSHTFGHYYCMEDGQTLDTFVDDLQSAATACRRSGYRAPTSLVFPRNQYRSDYFGALENSGFVTFRGNPGNWFWRPGAARHTTKVQRAVRLADNYFTFGRSTIFDGESPVGKKLHNVPASRFFRPYIKRIDGYGGQLLKIRRIRREMEEAARTRMNYHLWWHPHNLATDPERNMAALAEIILTYSSLRQRYGWESHSMESYTAKLIEPV